MKVICVKLPRYFTTAKYTLYKIYDIFYYNQCICLLDDDGYTFVVTDSIFITLDVWRNQQIDKILEND